MSKYLYNGWEFEQLPNQETHPWLPNYAYKTIYQDELGDYYATLSDMPFRLSANYAIDGELLWYWLTTPGSGIELRYRESGFWNNVREFSPESPGVLGPPSYIIVGQGATVIWSNYNILYDDGRQYLPAGLEPFPVEPEEPDEPDVPVEPEEPPVEEKKDFCLRSWLTGFCLGMAGKPLPMPSAKKSKEVNLYDR